MKWGGELARRLPAREINQYTPDFHTIRIDNVIIDHCKQLVSALGLPERPLRNVLISRITANCEQFVTMRDVNAFVMQDASITATEAIASIDGCTGIMMLNTMVNGIPPASFVYPGVSSTPVMVCKSGG